MASDTYTKTVEMDDSIEMSKSDIEVSKNQNPFADKHEHASDGKKEQNWSVISTTSSNKLFMTENQRLLSDTETDTDSDDGSSCTSDDDDDESICASNCESTCTEEQELDNAQKCKDLESKIEDLEAEFEECWSEKVALFDDKEILLEKKKALAKEKHLLLKETSSLLKEKKVLVVEKVNLLETVEKLCKEKKIALAKYNVETSRFVGEHNACINSMQHAIDEKSTLLAEKQRLLEAAEALAAQKIKDVVDSAREIEHLKGSHSADLVMMQKKIDENEALLAEKQKLLEASEALGEEKDERVSSLAWKNMCLMDLHNTTVGSMRKTINDKDILLAEKQKLLEAAQTLAEQKSQDAEKSEVETQRLRDQEDTTFALMEDTLKTLKNEHTQELMSILTEFDTFKSTHDQQRQMYECESEEQYMYLKDSSDIAKKEYAEKIAGAEKVIEDLKDTMEEHINTSKALKQKYDDDVESYKVLMASVCDEWKTGTVSMLESKLAHTKEWCDEVQNELALAQKERDDLRNELFDVKVGRDEVEAERDAFDSELDDMADLVCEMEEVDEKLLVAHEELAKANSDWLKLAKDVEDQTRTHRQQLDQMTAYQHELKGELHDTASERDAISSQLDALKDASNASEEELLEVKLSRDEYQGMLRQATADCTMLKEDSTKMMNDYQRLDGKWKVRGTEISMLEGELKDVKEELEDIKGNCNSLQGELNDLMIKHDIVEEKLGEAVAAGASLEDEVNEYMNKEFETNEANKKLQVFYHVFPAVKKYSGDGFQESLMNLEDEYTGTIDVEMLKAYLCSLMVEAEKEM